MNTLKQRRLGAWIQTRRGFATVSLSQMGDLLENNEIRALCTEKRSRQCNTLPLTAAQSSRAVRGWCRASRDRFLQRLPSHVCPLRGQCRVSSRTLYVIGTQHLVKVAHASKHPISPTLLDGAEDGFVVVHRVDVSNSHIVAKSHRVLAEVLEQARGALV